MSTSISFHCIDIKFKLSDKSKISKWIKSSIKSEQKFLSEINYIFCSDEYLLTLNQDYLKHNTYTDIITFDYTQNNIIAGDIFISVDRVKENAELFNVDFKNELSRVIIHGVLHLIGYNDKTSKQKAVMRTKEDFYLNLLP